jgi:hypothetical protein
MLSQASMAIARQRLPAGAAAIPFYEKLLADHPELLSNRFNRGSQATGAQQQALAGSIARFARLVVDNPDRDPGPLLPRTGSPHSVSHRSSLIRPYSLSSAPARPTRCITVKLVADGVGVNGEVSTWLHANVVPAYALTFSPPYRKVVVDTGRSPLLLASGGIGSTPLIGILDHLVATSSKRDVARRSCRPAGRRGACPAASAVTQREPLAERADLIRVATPKVADRMHRSGGPGQGRRDRGDAVRHLQACAVVRIDPPAVPGPRGARDRDPAGTVRSRTRRLSTSPVSS